MTFQLQEVVPWGRTFDEYTQMFALTEQDLAGRIAGCADGPASFNALATQQGYRVTSFDPIYAFSKAAIEARIAATYDTVLAQTIQNQHLFQWDSFPNPEAMGQARMQAMQTFLADYESGLAAGRYIQASLPSIPAPDNAFDLALCSHYLFLYSDQVDEATHLASLLELCRLAPDVRIFPLHDLANQPSRHLVPMMAALTERGYAVEKHSVGYHFRKGDHWMLQIRRG